MEDSVLEKENSRAKTRRRQDNKIGWFLDFEDFFLIVSASFTMWFKISFVQSFANWMLINCVMVDRFDNL